MWDYVIIGIMFLLPIVISIAIWFLRRFVFSVGPVSVVIVAVLYGFIWFCGEKYFIAPMEVSNTLYVILNVFLGVGVLIGLIILDKSYDAFLSGIW